MGLSQDEMADRIELGRNAYRQIETGATHILNVHIEKIAAVLGVSVSTLVNGFDLTAEDSPILHEARQTYRNALSDIRKDTEGRIAMLEQENSDLRKRVAELETTNSNMQELLTFQRKELNNRKND